MQSWGIFESCLRLVLQLGVHVFFLWWSVAFRLIYFLWETPNFPLELPGRWQWYIGTLMIPINQWINTSIDQSRNQIKQTNESLRTIDCHLVLCDPSSNPVTPIVSPVFSQPRKSTSHHQGIHRSTMFLQEGIHPNQSTILKHGKGDYPTNTNEHFIEMITSKFLQLSPSGFSIWWPFFYLPHIFIVSLENGRFMFFLKEFGFLQTEQTSKDANHTWNQCHNERPSPSPVQHLLFTILVLEKTKSPHAPTWNPNSLSWRWRLRTFPSNAVQPLPWYRWPLHQSHHRCKALVPSARKTRDRDQVDPWHLEATRHFGWFEKALRIAYLLATGNGVINIFLNPCATSGVECEAISPLQLLFLMHKIRVDHVISSQKIPPLSLKFSCDFSSFFYHPHLVGGFNTSEKYQSNWIIFPGIGVKNKKYLKPFSNHHLVIIYQISQISFCHGTIFTPRPWCWKQSLSHCSPQHPYHRDHHRHLPSKGVLCDDRRFESETTKFATQTVEKKQGLPISNPKNWGDTVDGRYPAPVDLVNIPFFYRVSYMSGGAGFLPSTASIYQINK